MKFTFASLVAISAIVAVHGRAIPEAQPEAIWDRLVSRFAGSFEARDDSRHHYGGFPGLDPTGIQGVVPGAGTTGKPTGTRTRPVGTGTAVLTGTGTRVVFGTGTAVYGTGTGIIIGTHTRFSVFPTGTGIIRSSASGISSKKPPAATPKTPHPSNEDPKTATDTAIQPPPRTTSFAQVITSIITVTQPPVTKTTSVTVTAPAVTVTEAGGGCGYSS